jgi:ABC-type glutathione transport system ATPase component
MMRRPIDQYAAVIVALTARAARRRATSTISTIQDEHPSELRSKASQNWSKEAAVDSSRVAMLIACRLRVADQERNRCDPDSRTRMATRLHAALAAAACDGRGHRVPVLLVSELRKTYGRTEALRGVALEVGEGELVGLLGPNGAGKSTLVKIACGLVRPTAGRAELL